MAGVSVRAAERTGRPELDEAVERMLRREDVLRMTELARRCAVDPGDLRPHVERLVAARRAEWLQPVGGGGPAPADAVFVRWRREGDEACRWQERLRAPARTDRRGRIFDEMMGRPAPAC